MIRPVAFACAVLAAAASASPMFAGDTIADTPQISVVYADLDLSRPAGIKVLLARLETAADVVCGGRPQLRELWRGNAYRRCVDRAMDNAVAALHRPLVADLYGKPQLVAETRQVDRSMTTAETSSNAANAKPKERNLVQRVGAFVAGIFD